MSLELSVKGLVQELDYGKSFLAPYIETLEQQKKALVGQAFRKGYGRAQPDNHALELLSIFRPRIIRGNPRVRWQAWSDDPKVKARAMARTLACNALSMRLQLRNLNEAALSDWIFKWAAGIVTCEPQPGMRDTKDVDYWPSVKRISTKRFRYDPAALTMGQREWTAHLTIESRGALVKRAADERAGWNVQAINAIKGMNVAQFRDENAKIPERDEIAYWTVHCPFVDAETDKPGYRGRVFTVVDNQSGTTDWIREPYDWFGPPEGMHIMAGDIVVPDESAPMGPVTATKHQEEYVNRVSRAIIRGLESRKNILIVKNGTNLTEILKSGLDGHLFQANAEYLKDAIVPVTVGGIDEQFFAGKMDARQSLDRASGITDIMRGTVDSRNKATQDALAAQAAEGKAIFPVGKFADNWVGEYFRRMGWYLDMDENVGINIPSGVAEANGLFDPKTGRPLTRIEGGLDDDQDPDEIAQADLSVDIGSMASDLDSDAGARINAISNYIQKMQAIVGPVGSLYTDCEAIAEAEAQLSGIPEIRHIFDFKKMRALGLILVTQGGEAQDPGTPDTGGNGQPQYSKTIQAHATPQLSKAPGLAGKAASGPQSSGKMAAKPRKPAMAGAKGS